MRRRAFISSMSAIGIWPIYRLSSQPRTKFKQFVDRHNIEKMKNGECGFIDNHLFCLADNGVDGCLWFNPSSTTAVFEEPCEKADVFLNGNTLMARTTLVWKRGDEFWSTGNTVGHNRRRARLFGCRSPLRPPHTFRPPHFFRESLRLSQQRRFFVQSRLAGGSQLRIDE